MSIYFGAGTLDPTRALNPLVAASVANVVRGSRAPTPSAGVDPTPMDMTVSGSSDGDILNHPVVGEMILRDTMAPPPSLFQRLGPWAWLLGAGAGVAVLFAAYMVMKKKKSSVAGYRRRRSKR